MISYARWKYQHLKEHDDICDLGVMPEVRQIFDNHLDLTNDPNLSLWSIYGRFFPMMYCIDKIWTVDHVSDIFPEDPQLSHVWEAAWVSYVVYNNTYTDVYKTIANVYLRAVEHRLPATWSKRTSDEYTHRLVEHLVLLYGIGAYELAQEGNPLSAYINTASDEEREGVMQYMGTTEATFENMSNADVARRWQDYWESRLVMVASENNLATHINEIGAFGWWFSQDLFPEDWALNNLHAALKLISYSNPVHEVISALDRSDESKLATVVNCLGLIVDGPQVYSYGTLWVPPAQAILRRALADPSTQKMALELQNKLVAKGYIDPFKDLGGS